jgi:hypothetical protein
VWSASAVMTAPFDVQGVQQRRECLGLRGLVADLPLAGHHGLIVQQRGEQMHRAVLIAGAAHLLAVQCDGDLPGRDPPGGDLDRHPPRQRGVQSLTIEVFQQPPQRLATRAAHPPGALVRRDAQRQQDLIRGVPGPPEDRGHRVRPAQHRRRRDRHQCPITVPAPLPAPRIRQFGQEIPQVSAIGNIQTTDQARGLDRHRAGDNGPIGGRGGEHGRLHGRRGSL